MRLGIVIAIGLVAVAVNAAALFVAFGDVFVSHARLPDLVPECARCSEPEIQRALQFVHASARGQIAEHLVAMWPWWLVVLLINVGAPLLAWRLGRGESAI